MAATSTTPLLSLSLRPLFPSPSSFAPRRLGPPRSAALRVAAAKLEAAKVVPHEDRVLIRLEKLAQKSSGGVLLPKSAVKFERYLVGEILSVGDQVEDVEAGKKVIVSDINAYEVDMGGDAKHCFCRANDLIAVIE